MNILDKLDFKIHGDRVKLEIWLRKAEMDKILSDQRLAKIVEEQIIHYDEKRKKAWYHSKKKKQATKHMLYLQSLVEKSKENQT